MRNRWDRSTRYTHGKLDGDGRRSGSSLAMWVALRPSGFFDCACGSAQNDSAGSRGGRMGKYKSQGEKQIPRAALGNDK